MPRLISVNVGLPREITWRGKTVFTSVWKQPVQGRRMVRRLNIDGDAQGDLAGHGGEHRAVFVYQMESCDYWQRELGRSDLTFGQFGENFTVEGLADSEVCIGDRYRIGEALLEVTQPRVTCYRVGIRMNEPRMPSLLVAHHRPGFYFRVLEEGAVGAGDEIVRVSEGPERLTIAQVDALLYLPEPARDQLQRALNVPALSSGWKASFEALLRQDAQSGSGAGNAGLVAGEQLVTATPGFRSLKVARIEREGSSAVSVVLEPTDGTPLTVALPGQFVVLRLNPQAGGSPVFRSYSLSNQPGSASYRVTIKQEPHGIASTYVNTGLRIGDVLEVSEPRGGFTLIDDDLPVVLISAGVGVTPVLAMLHSLAAGRSTRPIWWIHGARSGPEQILGHEARGLVTGLPAARSRVLFSRPDAEDRQGVDFDATGRVTAPAIEELGVPREADFYLCGPTDFMDAMTAGLAQWGVAQNRIHTELFGSAKPIEPGVVPESHRAPHPPPDSHGDGPAVSFARSGLTVRWDEKYGSLLELAEACDVPVRWSCRSGVCHTCECGLVSGSVKYDPDPLGPPAAGNLLICCSRPGEDLVIDL